MDEILIQKILDTLKNDGIILLPTDTVYGLAILPESQKAKERLYRLKRRPENFNLPIMVNSIEMIEELGFIINDCAKKLLHSNFIPGPLTLILPLKENRVFWLKGRIEAAVRIPNDEFLLKLIDKTGPLLVTSANIHRGPILSTVCDIIKEIPNCPNLILDFGKRDIIPSTIVNCRLSPPIIEREGKILKEQIYKIIKK